MKFLISTFILFSLFAIGQEKNETTAIDASFLTGNVLIHSKDVIALTGHPEGIILNFSRKSFGNLEWQRAYNYPDYGAYFLYQDFKNPFLGKNYALGAHYNFYFFKRKLSLDVGQGIALVTNPYDKITNNKNKAFGSPIIANINLSLQYRKDHLFDNFGLQAGFIFTHFSSGRFKAPNSGINTFNVNLGLNYNFDKPQKFKIDSTDIKTNYREPIKYNLILRAGVNESSIINSGQHPFYHIGFYADKRINRKSAFQLGTEVFLSNYVKNFIKYQSVAYPDKNIDANTDYKKVGIFIGHELFINRLSFEAQLGYYVYQPFKFDIPIYDRIGVKYYLAPKIFTGFSLKTHGFLAEAFEFVIGTRF
jgi:Lipid A 3-O-deacylase (PagL)